MATEPATTTRLQYATASLISAAETISLLCENVKSPTLLSIAATTNSLLKLVQTIKQNKDDCIALMEQISQLLYAISTVYIQWNTGESELSPSMLAHVGNFSMILHKIHTFFEAQQDGSKIKKWLRNAEMNTLLKECKVGLQQAFNIFKSKAMNFLTETHSIEEEAQTVHRQVLDLVNSFSSSEWSLTSNSYSSSFRSSTSFSLLPSEPKIFHGREVEVAEIIKQFVPQRAPHIAILGPGGIGKTSLARTVLHNPALSIQYANHRVFVACDTTSSRKELESLIGSHLGLKLGKNAGRQIIGHYTQSPPSLLILDNMETLWEPVETRKEIEELLSCLADIEHLALIITMRGAERPGGIQWTRPFLPPLQVLTLEAARRTFIDISDDAHDCKDIEKILHLTDNLPLAVSLMAYAAESEGCSAVLYRWEKEKTTAVSDGYDKRSSLDISISLSLSSPRLALVSGAHGLLSLLSILPDGLSERDLEESQLSIDNILECKAALLRTSLAYVASTNRIKVLVPVREYIKKYHPPLMEHVEVLFHKYKQLLNLCKQNAGTTANSEITPQIRLNLANFQGILSSRLSQDLSPGAHNQTLYFGLDLNRFSYMLGHGAIPFMEQICSALPRPITDHRLEVYFITEYIVSSRGQKADALVKQGFKHIPHFVDTEIQYRFYLNAAEHFRQQFDIDSAMKTRQKALSVAKLSGNYGAISYALSTIASLNHDLSAHTVGLQYAKKAQQAAKQGGDLLREANALRLQAWCWVGLGNYKMAISQSQLARSLLVLCGNAGGDLDQEIMTLLAEVHLLKSEYIQARDINTQILSTHKQTPSINQDSWGTAVLLLNVGQIDSVMGALTQDVQNKIDAARQILRNTGWKRYLPACEAVQAKLNLRDGNFALAQELFAQQLKLCWGKYNEVTSFCLERLADVHQWGVTSNLLQTWPVVLLAYASKTKEKLPLYKALQFLGDVSLDGGENQTASSLYHASLEGFTYMDVHCSQAECMLHLGDIAKAQGNFMKAEELWKAALPLFEYSSQTMQVALVNKKLATICTVEDAI